MKDVELRDNRQMTNIVHHFGYLASTHAALPIFKILNKFTSLPYNMQLSFIQRLMVSPKWVTLILLLGQSQSNLMEPCDASLVRRSRLGS